MIARIERREGRYAPFWIVVVGTKVEPMAFARKADAQALAELMNAGA